jgi:predicted Zn finger-like uncharacterized protein
MIIQCQSCAAKYFLPEEKVPVDPLKVRCPKCRAVFMLAGKRERVAVGAGVSPAAPAPAPVIAERMAVAPAYEAPAPVEMAPRASAPAPVAPAPVAPAPVVQPAAPAMSIDETLVEMPAAPDPAPAPAAEPEGARPSRGSRSPDDRAKRLARVLVSDILWYNRERRDAALRDGTLMTSLGEEIKKSWELYKEKVGPEAAHSTNYFKEALNEILADGQQVF